MIDETTLKVRYVNQGRSDGLVALASVLGWSRGKTIGMGKRIGVLPSEAIVALERAHAYEDAS